MANSKFKRGVFTCSLFLLAFGVLGTKNLLGIGGGWWVGVLRGGSGGSIGDGNERELALLAHTLRRSRRVARLLLELLATIFGVGLILRVFHGRLTMVAA